MQAQAEVNHSVNGNRLNTPGSNPVILNEAKDGSAKSTGLTVITYLETIITIIGFIANIITLVTLT